MLETFLNSKPVSGFFDWLSDHGLTVVITIAVALFFYHFINFIIDIIVKRVVRKNRFNQMTDLDLKKRQNTIIGIFSTVLRAVIIITATFVVIKEFAPNINLAPLFASAGIIGVALGFGAQSLVKDFITGAFIISENQYRVGDVIELGANASGTVEKISIRSTILRDVDGNVHYVPNGTITHVINKTMDFSKVNFTINIDHDTDIDKLSKIINDTGLELAEDPKWKEKILDPPHFVNLGAFTQFGMEVKIIGTTQPSDQWGVAGEMRKRLLKSFAKNKIVLAGAPNLSGIVGGKKK